MDAPDVGLEASEAGQHQDGEEQSQHGQHQRGISDQGERLQIALQLLLVRANQKEINGMTVRYHLIETNVSQTSLCELSINTPKVPSL